MMSTRTTKTLAIDATRGWGLAGAVVGTALLLSGCATAATDARTADTEPAAATTTPSATPTVSPAAARDLGGEPVSGTGSTDFPGVAFPIPAEARSVVVEVECTAGASLTLEVGDSMMLGQAPQALTCDSPMPLSWPIVDRTGPTLYVGTADDVVWTVQPRFSTAEFESDEALAADCDAYSHLSSALYNADQGYGPNYAAFGQDEWADRVAAAAEQLNELATSAQSDFGDTFARVAELASAPDLAVGEASNVVYGTDEEFRQACASNHTELVIHSEFGG